MLYKFKICVFILSSIVNYCVQCMMLNMFNICVFNFCALWPPYVQWFFTHISTMIGGNLETANSSQQSDHYYRRYLISRRYHLARTYLNFQMDYFVLPPTSRSSQTWTYLTYYLTFVRLVTGRYYSMLLVEYNYKKIRGYNCAVPSSKSNVELTLHGSRKQVQRHLKEIFTG